METDNKKPGNVLTTIMPFLIVNSAVKAIEFYINGLGAKEIERYEMGEGKIGARLMIDGAEFCIGDEEAEYGNLSPTTIGGSPYG